MRGAVEEEVVIHQVALVAAGSQALQAFLERRRHMPLW